MQEPPYGPPPAGVRSPYAPPHQVDSGRSIWRTLAIGLGVLVGLPVVLFLIVAIYAEETGPKIFAQPASQVSAKHKSELRDLGLISDEEPLEWMYSDGFFDLKEGVYLFTDRAIKLYSEEWDPPTIVIPFEEVVDYDVEYTTDFLDDSTVTVLTADGSEYFFPVSNENGNDKRFVEALQRKLDATWADPDE